MWMLANVVRSLILLNYNPILLLEEIDKNQTLAAFNTSSVISIFTSLVQTQSEGTFNVQDDKTYNSVTLKAVDLLIQKADALSLSQCLSLLTSLCKWNQGAEYFRLKKSDF